MSEFASIPLLRPQRAYQLWARSYDATKNPLFSLEERQMAALLESAEHCDVVDLGCGTGRLLKRIAASEPESLTGVDLSAAMLKRAAGKLGFAARLIQADCLNTTLATASADWISALFLLSYLDNVRAFAREAARIARPGAFLIFSDVHPEMRRHKWRRTFCIDQQIIEIQTHPYELDDLHIAMAEAGCDLEQFNEHCFGGEEEAVFVHAGRPDLFEAAKGLPVMFLASYRRRRE